MPLIYSMPTTYKLRESDDSYHINIISPKDPHSYEIAAAKLTSGRYKLIIQGDNTRRDFIVGPIDHNKISMTMSDAFSPYGNVLKISVPKIVDAPRDPFDVARERVIAAQNAEAERVKKERAARVEAQRAAQQAAHARAQAKAEARANAQSVEAQAMEALRAETQRRVEAARKAEEAKNREAEDKAKTKEDFTPQDLMDILGGVFQNVQLGSNHNGYAGPKDDKPENPLEALLKAFVPQFVQGEDAPEEKPQSKENSQPKYSEPQSAPSKECTCSESYEAVVDRLEKKYAAKFEAVERLQKQLEEKLATSTTEIERRVSEKVAELEKHLVLKISQTESSFSKTEQKLSQKIDEVSGALKTSERKLAEKLGVFEASVNEVADKVTAIERKEDSKREDSKREDSKKEQIDKSQDTDDYEHIIKATYVEESPLTPSTNSPLPAGSPIGSPVIKTHLPEMQEVEDEEFVMIRKKFGE